MHQIRFFIMCELHGVRRGLSAIFSSENSFDVVGEAGIDADAVAEAQRIQPDAILCESPSNTGNADLIRLLKEACPYTKVFIFIQEDNIGEARAAVARGVDGCLTKTMLPCHLVKAVELTCRTGVMCLPGSLKCLLISREYGLEQQNGHNGEHPVPDGDSDIKLKFSLTAREVEIYRLIVQNCSNKEIGKKLYISQPTVKSHVSNILRKLGLGNRTKLVLYEMQNRGNPSQ